MSDDYIEPDIIMNGVQLTKAQAMTVRVAIENFTFDLAESKHPTDILYLQRVGEIRVPMYANNPFYKRK